jgi:hypothetical protein
VLARTLANKALFDQGCNYQIIAILKIKLILKTYVKFS